MLCSVIISSVLFITFYVFGPSAQICELMFEVWEEVYAASTERQMQNYTAPCMLNVGEDHSWLSWTVQSSARKSVAVLTWQNVCVHLTDSRYGQSRQQAVHGRCWFFHTMLGYRDRSTGGHCGGMICSSLPSSCAPFSSLNGLGKVYLQWVKKKKCIKYQNWLLLSSLHHQNYYVLLLKAVIKIIHNK